MANLRISIVSYFHTPIEFGAGTGSIGDMIDLKIRDTLEQGTEITEVSLFFSEEDQVALRSAYALSVKADDYDYTHGIAPDGAGKKRR